MESTRTAATGARTESPKQGKRAHSQGRPAEPPMQHGFVVYCYRLEFWEDLRGEDYVDRPARSPPPLYVRRHGRPDRHPGRRCHRHHAGRIFPYIDIPIVSVLWVYRLSPEEMEKRVVTGSSAGSLPTSTTSSISNRKSYNGYAVVKIYFHPNVKIDMAVAQVTAHDANRAPPDAARDVSRQCSEVRRGQRSHPATRALEQDAARAGDLRPRQ